MLYYDSIQYQIQAMLTRYQTSSQPKTPTHHRPKAALAPPNFRPADYRSYPHHSAAPAAWAVQSRPSHSFPARRRALGSVGRRRSLRRASLASRLEVGSVCSGCSSVVVVGSWEARLRACYRIVLEVVGSWGVPVSRLAVGLVGRPCSPRLASLVSLIDVGWVGMRCSSDSAAVESWGARLSVSCHYISADAAAERQRVRWPLLDSNTLLGLGWSVPDLGLNMSQCRRDSQAEECSVCLSSQSRSCCQVGSSMVAILESRGSHTAVVGSEDADSVC